MVPTNNNKKNRMNENIKNISFFSYKLSAIITIYLQQGSYKVYLNEKVEKALNTF